MHTINQLIEQYIAIWNETDAENRRTLIEQTFTPDATYVDPMMQSENHEGIDTMIQAVQGQFPKHRFQHIGEVNVVQNRVRFSWNVTAPDGTVFIAGTDFGLLSEDNRFATVTGFLDQMPA